MIKEGGEITRGLIIAEPWIGKILRGEKYWEMRSSNTSVRGAIALIKKGSGMIVGTATIQDSIGPLSFDEIFDYEDKHRVGPETYTRDDYKWNYAWVLKDVNALESPVPYRHKSGAVIWVDLDLNAKRQLSDQLEMRVTENQAESPAPDVTFETAAETILASAATIPFARDGTCFCPKTCSRNGIYTVGEKGDEHRFNSCLEALDFLRSMPTAKWRRPNLKGNWGIVSAVKWESN